MSAVREILQMIVLHLANLDDSGWTGISGQIIVSDELDLEAVCYAAYGLCFLACLLRTVFDIGSPERPMSFEQSTAEDYDIKDSILSLSLLIVVDLTLIVAVSLVPFGRVHDETLEGQPVM